jgi:prepilin-type N-terminal cleavage/methylation domain-containing protein
MQYASQRTRVGFTLVELLVVIAIIGVLASLGTGASVMALKTIRRRVIKVECEGIEQALMLYESEYGEMPPDFSVLDSAEGRRTVNRHLYVRFKGKYKGDFSTMQQEISDNYGFDITGMSPDDALVFWLGGLPARKPASRDDPYVPAGFNSDNSDPFSPSSSRTPPTYSGFDPERIVWGDNVLQYLNSAPISTPYVYFKSRMVNVGTNDAGRGYDTSEQYDWYDRDNDGNAEDFVVPYAMSEVAPGIWTWYNEKGAQVITGGLDGEFGSGPITTVRIVKDGTGFEDGDKDNISNFCSSSTIGGDTE